jgi:ABC-type uncharacterized transport system involved in gliding motility auxiliary subunit
MNNTKNIVLWIASGVLAVGMLFARAVYPELVWLSAVVGVLLVAALGALVAENRKALRGRTAAFGLNSAVTIVLVLAIVGVVNFLGSRYPGKADLTANKLHTLADQTVKLVKGLTRDVKAVHYSKLPQREQVRPLLENLRGLNPRFDFEFVDPDKEPTRAKQVGVKKYGTLQLIVGTKDQKIEEPNEEKVTNALIKLLKDRSQTLCATTGHGEKSFGAVDAEGYEAVKKALGEQSYEQKDLNLIQEGKVPDTCDVVAIVGPTKAFFEAEVKALREYLANGGRALVALDVNLKGAEFAPELAPVLADWHVKPVSALVVDPLSRMLGQDASVSILATFSRDNPITKEFQGNALFPFVRPLEVVSGAPAGMNVQWLAQTTPKSWAESDFKELLSGQVRMTEGKDKAGPLNAAVAVDGKQKDSKAARNTRLVVFGSSYFATNSFSRFAGNLDFFMNAVSWLLEDENLISIRAKEADPGKVELSQKQGTVVFLVTVVLVPLLVAAMGVAIWVVRRRL